jgi:hypothetical protein
VALNCRVVPSAMLGAAGVTSIDTKRADVTVKVVLPAMAPSVAVIVVDPADNAVAIPAALIVAIAMPEDFQIALEEMTCLEPSL